MMESTVVEKFRSFEDGVRHSMGQIESQVIGVYDGELRAEIAGQVERVEGGVGQVKQEVSLITDLEETEI